MAVDSRWADAIGRIESGGRYDAVGPVTKNGGRAYGKYQVMAGNIGPWTKDVLGVAMTPQQFLASPEAQDAVFNAKFGQYIAKYGNPDDAASAWFTGRPISQGAGSKDVTGTSGAQYVARFRQAFAAQQQPQGSPAPIQSASSAPANVGGLLSGIDFSKADTQGQPQGLLESAVDNQIAQRLQTIPGMLEQMQPQASPMQLNMPQSPARQMAQLASPQMQMAMNSPAAMLRRQLLASLMQPQQSQPQG